MKLYFGNPLSRGQEYRETRALHETKLTQINDDSRELQRRKGGIQSDLVGGR